MASLISCTEMSSHRQAIVFSSSLVMSSPHSDVAHLLTKSRIVELDGNERRPADIVGSQHELHRCASQRSSVATEQCDRATLDRQWQVLVRNGDRRLGLRLVLDKDGKTGADLEAAHASGALRKVDVRDAVDAVHDDGVELAGADTWVAGDLLDALDDSDWSLLLALFGREKAVLAQICDIDDSGFKVAHSSTSTHLSPIQILAPNGPARRSSRLCLVSFCSSTGTSTCPRSYAAWSPAILPSIMAVEASSMPEASPAAKMSGLLVRIAQLRLATQPPNSPVYARSSFACSSSSVEGLSPADKQIVSQSTRCSVPGIGCHFSSTSAIIAASTWSVPTASSTVWRVMIWTPFRAILLAWTRYPPTLGAPSMTATTSMPACINW